MTNARPPVNLIVSKYRGPGTVTVAEARPKFEALKGGKPLEPYSGKASTTVTFSEPGDYMLHVTANDYSGNGGGGSGCCWTTVIVKVAVTGAAADRLNRSALDADHAGSASGPRRNSTCRHSPKVG